MTYKEYIAGIEAAAAAYHRATIAADYDLDAAAKLAGGISSRDSARHLGRMLLAREKRDATIWNLRSDFLATAPERRGAPSCVISPAAFYDVPEEVAHITAHHVHDKRTGYAV